MGEAATDVADEALREVHQAAGDAARVHQLAGEDEERDGHEREAVHAVVEAAQDLRVERHLAVEKEADAGCEQEHEDHGDAHGHEDEEEPEEGYRHCCSRLSSSTMPGGGTSFLFQSSGACISAVCAGASAHSLPGSTMPARSRSALSKPARIMVAKAIGMIM